MNFEMAAVPYWPIRRRKLIRRNLLIVAAILAIAVTVASIRHHFASQSVATRVFNEVVSTVSVRYYDRSFHGVDWDALVAAYCPRVEGAKNIDERYRLLQEMLSKLGDSHTAVFSPSDVGRVADQSGSALGAAFVTLGRDRVVLRVAPHSPAAAAGFRPGYIVAQSDDEGDSSLVRSYGLRDPLTGHSFQRRVYVGAAGSFDLIEPADLDWGTVSQNIAYLRLASFPNNMTEALRWAVSDVGIHPAMILDLRGNPGGLIDAVDETAGVFLARNSLVVSGIGRYEILGARRFTATDTAGIHYNGRLAVLVDSNSESGAEALASALQVYKRAIIVGTRTARKVLGVEVEQHLADGGLLRVATLKMRDANGEVLEGRGVTPDVVIARTAADIARGRDPQLRAAIHVLSALHFH